MSQTKKPFLLLTVPALMLAFTLPAMAQEEEEQPDVYARLATWTIERSQWGNFVKLMEQHFIPVLNQRLDQGAIFEWGLTTRALHSNDGPTHTLWFTANKVSGLLRTTEAIDAVERKLAGSNDPALAEFTNAVRSHSDSLVESTIYHSRPTNQSGGYVSVFDVEVAPGKGEEFAQWWRQYIQPVYQGLLDQGKVAAFGMDVEEYATTSPRARSFWVIVPDAEGIDAIDAAFEKAFGGRSPEELRGIFEHVRTDLIKRETRRSYLSEVIHYVVK